MLKQTSLILRNTAVTTRHLTPELPLRLITPASPLWRARAEDLPFEDPYWGFYWPGGQALARYILDNSAVTKGRKLLDVGCGCGAVSIAAAKLGAKLIVANDVDPNAITATIINAQLNDVDVSASSDNFIGHACHHFDTILIGDMFYDEQFANILFKWLYNLTNNGKTVLIGDPGRHGLTHEKRSSMTLLAKYELPAESCLENNGFHETTVWKLNK